MHNIFKYVGLAYPWLKEIQMKVFELPLRASALRVLLDQTKENLQSLDMCNVILKGSQDEFEALSNTLQQHKLLKQVGLDWCHPMSGGSLETVLNGLCNLKTLNQVLICGSVLSITSLRVLCSKESIQSLSLQNDTFTEDSITCMAEALESNHHLREFCGRLCGMDIATGKRFSNIIRVNNTLERLELQIDDKDWKAYGQCVTSALKVNSTLKYVTIYIDGNDTDLTFTADILTDALENHLSIKCMHLHVRGYFQKDALRRAFAGLIIGVLKKDTNHILQDLYIEGVPMSNEAATYLKANRAGLHNLKKNLECNNLWANALIRAKNDLALSHFLLSVNPSVLCNVRPINEFELLEADC